MKIEIMPYRRKVHFYETDQMGVVHHSNFIKWFEEARVAFMDQMEFSYERATEVGIDFAVLGVRCDYVSMVRFGETVDILLSFSNLTPTRMTVSYRVTDSVTGELRAKGETLHCYYSGKRLRPISLQRELPELFELFSMHYLPDKTDSGQ